MSWSRKGEDRSSYADTVPQALMPVGEEQGKLDRLHRLLAADREAHMSEIEHRRSTATAAALAVRGPAPAGPRTAGLVLLFSAALWGMSWWPMQQLAAAGVQGPAMALITYGAVGLAGLPLLWHQRALWRDKVGLLLLIAALGGWAAASFVMTLTQGDVVREMLLFYLAPAWSVLGGRAVLGERIGLRRGLALVLALIGAFLVIRAGGPIGSGAITTADWLALSSGVTFAANNLASRVAGAIPVTSKIIAALLGCALLSALTMAALGQALPSVTANVGLGLLGFALVWTFAGTWTTSYGVTHMEAGRAALIILSELVVAIVSASLMNGRVPSSPEIVGGVLILAAAAMDVIES